MRSRPVLALLSILVAFFAWGVISLLSKMTTTINNRRIVENKVAKLQKEKEKLSVDIARLQTADGVESSIREKFGLAKEGENLIIVTEEQDPVANTADQSSGFLSSFWNWFK